MLKRLVNISLSLILAQTNFAADIKQIPYEANNGVFIDKLELKNYKLEEIERILKNKYSEKEILKEKIELNKRKIKNKNKSENIIYCKFEVSFYTTSADEGSGTGIGASGEYVQPWISIALPKDIPFYSTAHIEGLGEFINHDTGSYINWAYDNEGNLVCRVDICVNTKEEAYQLGRFYADGYIVINDEN